MPNIGAAEIVIILVIALLVFGPKRLPEMGRSLGRSVREFKKASDTARKEFGVDEIERELKDVKTTLGDVKGDLKVDIDAEAGQACRRRAAAGAAVAAPAPRPMRGRDDAGADVGDRRAARPDDEVLVGDVVDEGRGRRGRRRRGAVEDAVVEEPVDVAA